MGCDLHPDQFFLHKYSITDTTFIIITVYHSRFGGLTRLFLFASHAVGHHQQNVSEQNQPVSILIWIAQVIITYLDDESERTFATLCRQNLIVDLCTRHLTDGIYSFQNHFHFSNLGLTLLFVYFGFLQLSYECTRAECWMGFKIINHAGVKVKCQQSLNQIFHLDTLT